MSVDQLRSRLAKIGYVLMVAIVAGVIGFLIGGFDWGWGLFLGIVGAFIGFITAH